MTEEETKADAEADELANKWDEDVHARGASDEVVMAAVFKFLDRRGIDLETLAIAAEILQGPVEH